jgi:type III secretory pathway component EscU
MEKDMDRKDDYNLIRVNRTKARQNNRISVHNLSDRMDDGKSSAYLFIENNTVALSLLSAVFVPYILGMLLTLVLFYFYVGVSVTDFFHVYSGLSQLLFWVLGSYFIITVADIWFLSRKFLGSR